MGLLRSKPVVLEVLTSDYNAIDVPDGKRVTRLSVEGTGAFERIVVELENIPIVAPQLLAEVTVQR